MENRYEFTEDSADPYSTKVLEVSPWKTILPETT